MCEKCYSMNKAFVSLSNRFDDLVVQGATRIVDFQENVEKSIERIEERLKSLENTIPSNFETYASRNIMSDEDIENRLHALETSIDGPIAARFKSIEDDFLNRLELFENKIQGRQFIPSELKEKIDFHERRIQRMERFEESLSNATPVPSRKEIEGLKQNFSKMIGKLESRLFKIEKEQRVDEENVPKLFAIFETMSEKIDRIVERVCQ